MRGGADQFDPCCYFHPVRLVREAISWLVITSNLLPVPSLSIIHHQLLPTRTGNGQCYFLRFFELWLIDPENNIYIRSSRLCDDEALLAFAREGVE